MRGFRFSETAESAEILKDVGILPALLVALELLYHRVVGATFWSAAVPNSNIQIDFNVSVILKVSTRALRLCFENSTRAIDSSKNQPNRLRCDRAREF
jgi:hypothetical protein